MLNIYTTRAAVFNDVDGKRQLKTEAIYDEKKLIKLND